MTTHMKQSAKKMGVWMNNSIAHLMEFSSNPTATTTICAQFSQQEKEKDTEQNNSLQFNRQQHQQLAYFTKLGEAIKQYESVILFGPTYAKITLFNMLKANYLFSKIKIDVRQTEEMTENQQHDFVQAHFASITG